MKEFKGTKWKLGDIKTKEGQFKTLTDDLWRMVIAFRHGNQIGDDKCIANEHLISAAPELLEALQETISCLDRYCIPETSEELKMLYLKSKNAVNKALGIKE